MLLVDIKCLILFTELQFFESTSVGFNSMNDFVSLENLFSI